MTATPRVDACIEAVMARFPGHSPSAQARYFEAVHQELAPLARELEQELAVQRGVLANLPTSHNILRMADLRGQFKRHTKEKL